MSPRLTSFPVVPRSANQLDRESGMMPIYGTMFSSDNTSGPSRLSHMRTHSAMSWRPPVEDRSRPRSHVLLAPPPKTTGRSRSRSMPPQHRHYLATDKQQKDALCDTKEDMDRQQRDAGDQDPEADVGGIAIPEIRPVSQFRAETPLPMSARRTRPNALLSPAIMPPYDMDKGSWQRRHSRNDTSATSPSSRSDFSLRSRNASFYEGIVERESDMATSPEASEDEDEQTKRKRGTLRYGTPEMPRGKANLPHRPPRALKPRTRNNGHVKHLLRAEKLPLSGYELLAARLSAHAPHLKHSRRGSFEDVSTWSARSAQSPNSTGSDGAAEELAAAQVALKPLYRRFEALNHRILLHLQDELSELEEQLHRLDTTDTQTRRLQDKILPASRRTSSLVGGELQWHKTDILGKISHKLGQYNHALSSFTKTQRLALPSQADIEDYRSYLTTQKPIAEIETRFIEATEDLITLTGGQQRLSPSVLGFPSTPFSLGSPSYLPTLAEGRLIPEPVRDSLLTHSTLHTKPTVHYSAVPLKDLHYLVVAMAVAVLAPVLAFTVLPNVEGRVTVTLFASVAVSCAMGGRAERRDILLCAGMYGAVMAVLAGLF